MYYFIHIPYEPRYFGLSINIHLVLEYLAFFVAFRYYVFLRNRTKDPISTNNRLVIIIGAVFGALLLSRVVAFLENPPLHVQQYWLSWLSNKTIMGGLFGGLLGVELAKKFISEKNSSGDLFTFPIIVGIAIGRLGCFLSGTKEFTYGVETTSLLGMDLGDGLYRHPLALYEFFFFIFLFILLRLLKKKRPQLKSGLLFQYFMISYFGFRFCLEFLKPNQFHILYLSSIQWLCIICFLYYQKTIKNIFAHAD